MNRGRESSSKLTSEAESNSEMNPDSQGRETPWNRGRGHAFAGGWRPLKCFICSGPHKAMDFPQNPKRVMMVQEEEGAELLPEEVEAERSENRMLRRALISGNKVTPEADWRRKSVFCTKCKCGDKVCKVIYQWRIH